MDWGNHFVLLETIKKDKDNSLSFLFTNPIDIITAYRKEDLEICFSRIDRYLQRGFYLAGFIAYEAGYVLEEVLRQYGRKSEYPLIWLGVYNKPLIKTSPFIDNTNAPYYLTAPALADNYREYKGNLEKIKKLISRGETYQINYTSEYTFSFIGDIFGFYSKLKKNQKVQYSALINYGDNFIVSLSPELFFRINENRQITMKPMKGTARTGVSRAWLPRDEKNISENVMIVDLLRNDLGRICLTGSVKVDRLYCVEKYETLQQMTSQISGILRPEVKIYDVLKSLFPSGSVTGAPKIQSMKIIKALEKKPRAVYTGTIGYFAPGGEAVFNVAIRTIELKNVENKKYAARMGIGSGIVHDSRAREEYQECRIKAEFLLNSMAEAALIETMFFAQGRIKHLHLHLRRLKKSARYFSMPCDLSRITSVLREYTAKLKGQARLRLLLKADGEITIEHKPLSPDFSVAPCITFSQHATRSDDPFLYHKTTFRKLYDQEYTKYSLQGYYDVIFCNEKNQVTEGAISNIIIYAKGRYLTPPLTCGLLNGIQRQVMIKRLNVEEKILYPEDLKGADKIILTNSLRGATEVIIEESL